MSAPGITIPVSRLTQWAFVVSRLSGVLSGANAAFAKYGTPLDTLTDGEREADALRSEIAALLIGAAMPAQGSQQ